MKRLIKIFFHNIRQFFRSKKNRYQLKFLLFTFFFLSILVIGIYSLIRSFAKYDSKTNLSLDIQTAMYVVEAGEMSFNIDLDKIVPSNDPYIYTFSISNFNEEKQSDVDLEYTLQLQTTTNLPLSYHLYYDDYDPNGKDIISSRINAQDEDKAWYNILSVDDKKEFNYSLKETYIYYLVVDFPEVYKSDVTYSDAVENIEVIINSKQII